jgi:hypothetical protein
MSYHYNQNYFHSFFHYWIKRIARKIPCEFDMAKFHVDFGKITEFGTCEKPVNFGNAMEFSQVLIQ